MPSASALFSQPGFVQNSLGGLLFLIGLPHTIVSNSSSHRFPGELRIEEKDGQVLMTISYHALAKPNGNASV
jgi:hypothetical protein